MKNPIAERRRVLVQIEAAWKHQYRRPTAEEVDAWRAVGRE
jgi:hypothetical protein